MWPFRRQFQSNRRRQEDDDQSPWLPGQAYRTVHGGALDTLVICTRVSSKSACYLYRAKEGGNAQATGGEEQDR